MAYVYVLFFKTKKFRSIEAERILDDVTKKPVPIADLKSMKMGSLKNKLYVQEEQIVSRVVPYHIADSLKELADKVNAERVKFPKRQSVGPMEISADEFFKNTEHKICEEEQEKIESAKSRVKDKRANAIIGNSSSSRPSSSKKSHDKDYSKSSESKEKESGDKNVHSRKGSSSKLKSKTDKPQSKTAKSRNKDPLLVDDLLKGKTIQDNSSEAGSSQMKSKSDEPQNEDVLEVVDDLLDRTKVQEKFLKRQSSTPVKSADAKKLKAECSLKEITTVTEDKRFLKEENMSLKEENENLKEENSSLKVENDSLKQENVVLKARVDELSTQAEKKDRTSKMVEDMQNKLGTLCNALQKDDNCSKDDSTKTIKKKKICPISLTTRVDSSDSEDEEKGKVVVPEGQIYLGHWKGEPRFASKKRLSKLEKVTVYSKRLVEVILMVFGDEDPTTYAFRSSDKPDNKKTKVEKYHTNAVYRLLKLLSWKKIGLNTIKYNATFLQPMEPKYVERTFQKMLVNPALEKAVEEARAKRDDKEEEVDEPKQPIDDEGDAVEEVDKPKQTKDDNGDEVEEAEDKPDEETALNEAEGETDDTALPTKDTNDSGSDTDIEELENSKTSELDTSMDVSMELPKIVL